MADYTLSSLLEILRDRDIPYNRDSIKAAFEDPKSLAAIQSWMQEYLGPETLLTKEEATLYANLLKSGEADKITAANDLSAVRGLSDNEIRDAIEELKRSTAAIEKQSEALGLQQNAMKMLMKTNGRTREARVCVDKSQQRKWDVEKSHMIAAVEELSQNLKYQTVDLEQQCKASEVSAKQTVDGILKTDDKLLSSLQKLANDLDPGKPEDEDQISRIKDLCARLIKHTVEGIRTRLDRVYLDTLKTTSEQSPETTEVIELQEELESLYSEILPVAQMSAEQQFLQPALRETAARSGQGQQRSEQAVKYMNDCLTFLVNRIEIFLSLAEEQQSHKMALSFVFNETKRELERSEFAPQEINPVTANAHRRLKSSSATPPTRKRTARRSSGADDDNIEPSQALLRNLGVSLPIDPVGPTSDISKIEILEKALFDRASKLENHASNLQSTTETSISTYLLDAQLTLQLLRDNLLAESEWGNVRLTAGDLEQRMDAFEGDVEQVQRKIERVDLRALQGRNVHRDEILARWSR